MDELLRILIFTFKDKVWERKGMIQILTKKQQEALQQEDLNLEFQKDKDLGKPEDTSMAVNRWRSIRKDQIERSNFPHGWMSIIAVNNSLVIEITSHYVRLLVS